LEDAAKADEAIICSDSDELVRLLWERIGNADYQRRRRRSVRRYSTLWV
jgi:hypothetical protein